MQDKNGCWDFRLHVVLSIFITALSTIADIVATGGTSLHLASIVEFFTNLGVDEGDLAIIGGADGPTAIFLSGSPLGLMINTKILLFLFLLVLYFPMRKLMNKKFQHMTSKK